MTIICIKDNIIAADSLVSNREGRIISTITKKITRSIDGAVGGAAGDEMACARFLKWFGSSTAKDRGIQTSFPINLPEGEFRAIWLSQYGSVCEMNHQGYVVFLETSIAAIGSASNMALGAMLAGFSARDAVQLCINNYISCGGDSVHVLPLKGTN